MNFKKWSSFLAHSVLYMSHLLSAQHVINCYVLGAVYAYTSLLKNI